MRLASLEIQDFRNIREAALAFSPGLNLLVGDNGQGKTNLVEAVAFLSWLRSFRTSRSQDLPTAGCPAARLSARVEGASGSRQIEVRIEQGHRRAWLDGKGVRSRREVREALAVVCLSPDDPAVLEGGGEGRRLLLDRLAWLLDPAAEGPLNQYARLLKERNRRLKDPSGPGDRRWGEALEEALAEAGAQVTARRLALVREMKHRLPETLRAFAGEDLRLSMRYDCRWFAGDGDPSREDLVRALRQRAEVDRAAGHTTAGPHTDDLEVVLQGLRARGNASRGQRKVLMVAWKAVEAALYRERSGEEPVMVLDDALADLDPDRQRRVLGMLALRPGQTFVTSAEARLDGQWGVRVHRAREGTFRLEQEEQG
ncbi:DNA replication/repair protein RecF [Myxococcota bacterium]|nr:DNA replication/repair protein RecF [Myxococcota bacterium]